MMKARLCGSRYSDRDSDESPERTATALSTRCATECTRPSTAAVIRSAGSSKMLRIGVITVNNQACGSTSPGSSTTPDWTSHETTLAGARRQRGAQVTVRRAYDVKNPSEG